MKVILVVDDEYDIVSSLELALTLEGYRALVAFNGKEALAQLEAEPNVDLILSDIMMPEMDGYALTRALRQDSRFAKIPLLLMSAAPLDEQKVTRGAWQFFIRKPFHLDRLLAQITTHLVGDEE